MGKFREEKWFGKKPPKGGSEMGSYINKFDLVLSFDLCVARERKETVHHISKLKLLLVTAKMVEIKSLIKKLEIDFYRTRKGKPPFNNAEVIRKQDLCYSMTLT